MHYYLEYVGGLGDIFFQIHLDGSYQLLDRLAPDDHATIVLNTHNPHVREIFDHHPLAGQFEIREVGYWPWNDPVLRKKHGLPPGIPDVRESAGRLHFYPSKEDVGRLSELDARPYIVFSVCAGDPQRDIPVPLVHLLTRQARRHGFLPVFVGRNYDRRGRVEYRPDGGNDEIDLIDRLTVPGVCRSVSSAAGVVCCHSSVNMLSWLIRKPQLLLYPNSVYERHVTKRDRWAFGIDFPECFHGLFDGKDTERLGDDFFQYAVSTQQSMCRTATTVPMPHGVHTITINETIRRLTSPAEVKFLCWLAQQSQGNIVEIGSNKGLTTRDLAQTNRDKTIYAVDYLSSDHRLTPTQCKERPALEDFCVFARDMENVVRIHCRPDGLNYAALRDVRMVFIDGDHTFRGVKAHTEPALDFLKRNGGGIIVWRYYAEGPLWAGVRQYVNSLNLEIEHIQGTWLAVARIQDDRRV